MRNTARRLSEIQQIRWCLRTLSANNLQILHISSNSFRIVSHTTRLSRRTIKKQMQGLTTALVLRKLTHSGIFNNFRRDDHTNKIHRWSVQV